MNTQASAQEVQLPLEGSGKRGNRRKANAEQANLPAVAEVMQPSAVPAVLTPMQMLQIAVEQNADLEKIQQLMDLQERWERNEARKAYVEAMAAFKAEPPTLVKNKHVKFETTKGVTEYHHATLDQVAGMIGAALSKHGLSHAWKTEQLDVGQIRVTCTITHIRGHSESVWLQSSRDESGGKNNIQAVGSTVSYLERYTLLAITGLATKDQDDDARGGDMGETISSEQKEMLIDLIKETRTSTEKYLKHLRIETLDDLPARRFNEAKLVLEARRGTRS